MRITRRKFTQASLAAGTLGAMGVPVSFADDEPLIKKVIPATGEKVPVVGLGTNRYGVGDDEAQRAPQSQRQEQKSRRHDRRRHRAQL